MIFLNEMYEGTPEEKREKKMKRGMKAFLLIKAHFASFVSYKKILHGNVSRYRIIYVTVLSILYVKFILYYYYFNIK